MEGQTFKKVIQMNNNFTRFKLDFTKDTGEDLTSNNMPIYIAYVNARLLDEQNQILSAIDGELNIIQNKMPK